MNLSKKLLFGALLLLSYNGAKATLTDEQAKKAIRNLSLPQDHSIRENLETFFEDPDVRAFFVDRIKGAMFNQWTGTGKKLRAHLFIQRKQLEAQRDWQSTADLLPQIIKKYGIELLKPNGNTFVLKSKNFWPGYLVKIAKYDWYDNTDYEKDNSNPQHSLYQNISRVFYASAIRVQIEKKGLKHIYPLQKYLFHIPGQPKNLNDDNYVVVSEYIKDLSDEKNARIFKGMGGKITTDPNALEKYGISEKYIEPIVELDYVIQYCGLFDISPKHVFYTNTNTKDGLKFVLIDLEKPGIGGGPDSAFFYQDHESRYRNGLCGENGLLKCWGLERDERVFVQKKEKKDDKIIISWQELKDKEQDEDKHDRAYYLWESTIKNKSYMWPQGK